MITLRQLIEVAPFPPETKKELLSQEDSLSEDKKFQLEELCWQVISQWYQNELRAKQEIAMLEMAKGEKEYSREDFKKMGDDLFEEFLKKLKSHANEQDLSEAREKLGDLLKEQTNN